MELTILFYHPKNPQNLADVAAIAKHVSATLIVVERPGAPISTASIPPNMRQSIRVYRSVEEYAREAEAQTHIVLETYGSTLLPDIDPAKLCKDKCTIVVGAEDYGIPLGEAEKLPGRKVYVKVPVAVWGMSYNVVSTLVMALYEILRGKTAPKAGTHGTGGVQ